MVLQIVFVLRKTLHSHRAMADFHVTELSKAAKLLNAQPRDPAIPDVEASPRLDYAELT